MTLPVPKALSVLHREEVRRKPGSWVLPLGAAWGHSRGKPLAAEGDGEGMRKGNWPRAGPLA